MQGDAIMEQPKIGEELQKIPYEPLLPIEMKLIRWSLGLGVGLMAVLIFVSYTYFPSGG
jgi:hypothetical protein